MKKYLIKDISIVNEGQIKVTDVLIANERIEKIGSEIHEKGNVTELEGAGKHLFPGVIDDQVHFREPGLTHKGDLYTESRAAVAGGVTSFMEMPNTIPNALTLELLEEKYTRADRVSLGNYSFYMGVSNDNAEEVLKVNAHKENICGVKIFMGSSTGNMLVEREETLKRIFSRSEMLIACHCEKEEIISRNLKIKLADGQPLEPRDHPIIRDAEACYASSSMAAELARQYGTRLHILHITTGRELELFTNDIPLSQKKITSEVCVHHLHFTADDYATLGYLIKCNPAIKSPENKAALWKALLDNHLDVIATDHAPHLLSEKGPNYENAHAGLPLVQHALSIMLHYHRAGMISLEKIAEKMCHAVADCFRVKERGYIREGYYADLVIVDLREQQTISKSNILYKCGWSPLENQTLPGKISHTFVNGNLVFENGIFHEEHKGKRLTFEPR
jgi:dihydroorotase